MRTGSRRVTLASICPIISIASELWAMSPKHYSIKVHFISSMTCKPSWIRLNVHTLLIVCRTFALIFFRKDESVISKVTDLRRHIYGVVRLLDQVCYMLKLHFHIWIILVFVIVQAITENSEYWKMIHTHTHRQVLPFKACWIDIKTSRKQSHGKPKYKLRCPMEKHDRDWPFLHETIFSIKNYIDTSTHRTPKITSIRCQSLASFHTPPICYCEHPWY